MDTTGSNINSLEPVETATWKKRGKNRKEDEERLIENGKGSEVETDAVSEEAKFNYPDVSYLDVFQFGSRSDVLLFLFGLLAAVAQG